MVKQSGIFLGKKGKVFGPFTKAEYEQMFASGELDNYTWIWHQEGQVWKTIEMPPAPPYSSGQEKEGKKRLDWHQVRALCFDHFSLASGKIECVTESGCELISHELEAGVKFPIQKRIELSLFDAPSRKSTTVEVEVAKVEMRDRAWVYRLKWSGVPQL